MVCVKILPTTPIPQEIEDAINAGVLIVPMTCTHTEAPGDIVRLHASTANLVEKTVDNTVNRPAIGVIKDKQSATTCRVVVTGVIDFTIGIGRVYLSETGVFTLTSPSNVGGYRQALGYSFGNGKLNLAPELKLTLNT